MTGPWRDVSSDRLADLYDRFAGTLFRHAAMILADRAAAADVVHTVFLKLAKAGSGGDVESLAYLRRGVRNECYSVMRTRRRDIVIAVDVSWFAQTRDPSQGDLARYGRSGRYALLAEELDGADVVIVPRTVRTRMLDFTQKAANIAAGEAAGRDAAIKVRGLIARAAAKKQLRAALPVAREQNAVGTR